MPKGKAYGKGKKGGVANMITGGPSAPQPKTPKSTGGAAVSLVGFDSSLRRPPGR